MNKTNKIALIPIDINNKNNNNNGFITFVLNSLYVPGQQIRRYFRCL